MARLASGGAGRFLRDWRSAQALARLLRRGPPRLCLSLALVLRQRADAAAAEAPSSADGAGAAAAVGGAPAAQAAPRILRTYGQRRPKADARSEAAPTVAADVLALIAGRGMGR